MYLGWGTLALLCLGIAVAWFWQDSLRARERANQAAMEACSRLGLQFLDGTAAFARIALARRDGGTLAFRRTYVFDYTANSIERRQGFVVMLAHRIESIGYAPDEVRTPTSALESRVEAAPPQSSGPDRSRVLDLEDWRSRQRSGTAGAPQRRENEDSHSGRSGHTPD
jgi:hypothetical protein